MSTTLRPPIHTVPQTPAAPQPPVVQPQQKKTCVAEFEKDGSLTITFTVSAEMAKRFVRQAGTQDLATYCWITRGLRHFEHQPLI